MTFSHYQLIANFSDSNQSYFLTYNFCLLRNVHNLNYYQYNCRLLLLYFDRIFNWDWLYFTNQINSNHEAKAIDEAHIYLSKSSRQSCLGFELDLWLILFIALFVATFHLNSRSYYCCSFVDKTLELFFKLFYLQ